jgi:hypothetical protein
MAVEIMIVLTGTVIWELGKLLWRDVLHIVLDQLPDWA